MYHVSAQGVDKRMINVHYYYLNTSPLVWPFVNGVATCAPPLCQPVLTASLHSDWLPQRTVWNSSYCLTARLPVAALQPSWHDSDLAHKPLHQNLDALSLVAWPAALACGLCLRRLLAFHGRHKAGQHCHTLLNNGTALGLYSSFHFR